MSNNLKTAALLACLGGLMIAIGSSFGRGGMFIGLIMGLMMVGGSYWFSDKVAIKSARAVPADRNQHPQYFAIMEDLTSKAGMPMPALYITPNPQPNAFATGRNPSHAAVAITQGLTQILSWDEIRGVLAHEVMHIKNRDILIGSVAALVAMVVTYLARMAMWGAMMGGRRDNNSNPLVMIATAVLAPVAAAVIKGAISRTREYKADASAAELLGTGEPLAAALEKLAMASGRISPEHVRAEQASHYIVNPLAAGPTQSDFGRRRGGMGGMGGMGNAMQFGKMFATHPPINERIELLRSGSWTG